MLPSMRAASSSDIPDLILSAAERAASSGRDAEAVILAWGAILEDLYRDVRQWLVHDTGRPPAEALAAAQRTFATQLPGPGGAQTAAEWLLAMRAALIEAMPPELSAAIGARSGPSVQLMGVGVPTLSQLHACAEARTGGSTVADFARERRSYSADRMRVAQEARVRGQTGDAIHEAYAADLAATEAYLFESAAALGDQLAVTAFCRWQVVLAGIAALPSIPPDFVTAVSQIRSVILDSLPEADADRLRGQFLPL